MFTKSSILACICIAAVALLPGADALTRDQLMKMAVSHHKMTKGIDDATDPPSVTNSTSDHAHTIHKPDSQGDDADANVTTTAPTFVEPIATAAPTTDAPTTAAPTTAAPTTAAPTTAAHTSAPVLDHLTDDADANVTTTAPTFVEPITTAPPTTVAPATEAPTTAAPTTAAHTAAAHTSAPVLDHLTDDADANVTTTAPASAEPITSAPTTASPTTAEPTTSGPEEPTSAPIPDHVTDDETPEPTCTYQVSVVGDATYCVEDVACGDIGTACPEANATAWGDCHSHLASFQEGACIAPWNSTCQVLRSVGDVDIRGCVWSRELPKTDENNEGESNVRSSSVGASGGSAQDASAPIVYGVSGLALVLAVAAVAIATSKVPTASADAAAAKEVEQEKSQEDQDEEAAEADAKHLSEADCAVVEV